jgi:hypothetical protein
MQKLNVGGLHLNRLIPLIPLPEKMLRGSTVSAFVLRAGVIGLLKAALMSELDVESGSMPDCGKRHEKLTK